MADETLKHDANRAKVIGGVTDDASTEIAQIRVDPITKRLLVDNDVESVTIKDDVGGVTASITTRGSKGALAIEVLDASGNQVTSFGGSSDAVSTIGDAVPSSGIYVSGVDDNGNLVGLLADTDGHLQVDVCSPKFDNLDDIKSNTAPGTTPTIYNVALTTANTEYSQLLPTGTRKIDAKLRATNALLKIAFVSTESGSNYITIPYGSSLHLENVDLSSVTIYAQSPTASQTLEILAWT